MWASTPILCSKFSAHLYKLYYLTSFQNLKAYNTSVARNARVRRYDTLDRTILTNKQTNKQTERGSLATERIS
jgi:hypothetical protein